MPRHPSCALSSLTYFLTITSSLSNVQIIVATSYGFAKLFRVFPLFLPFAFRKNLLISVILKSFPICCFHFLNVFSLFSFQCAGQRLLFQALSKLNNYQVNWSPCLTRITSRPQSRVGLLRKEVIQPLVLERLPCYDFTPIITPTLGHALLKGWTMDFGCSRLSWCDGRCVQDPGTYSPRHADPRLLAIPPSCSRVSDCNPN